MSHNLHTCYGVVKETKKENEAWRNIWCEENVKDCYKNLWKGIPKIKILHMVN